MAREPEKVVHTVSLGAIVKVIAVLALCAVLYILRDIVLVVIVAVVIASALEPSTRWFVRRGSPRTLAVISQYLLLSLVLSAFFYFLVLPLASETSDLLRSAPSYLHSAEVWNPTNRPAGGGQSAIDDIAGAFSVPNIMTALNDTLSGMSQGFISTLSGVFGGVLSFLLILVLSFYLSVQERGIARFLALVTPLRHRKYVLSLWDRAETKLGRWMQGQLILSATVGAIVYVGLLVFGIPNALTLAFLAGLMEIIPVFGPIIAAVPGVLLALAEGGLSKAIFVGLFYTATQQLESNFIYPQVMRKVIGVPAIISILALIAGGRLLGFLGIIVSVPIAAVVMEYLDDVQKDKDEEEERLARQNAS